MSTEHKKWTILILTLLFSAVTYDKDFLDNHWTQTTARRQRVIYPIFSRSKSLFYPLITGHNLL